MQRLLAPCFAILTVASFGQTKYDHVQFDKLIELRGTHFVIATIENHGKTLARSNEHLLVIDTKNGQTKQVSFPSGALIQKVEQVKIDSLGINRVIVIARTLNVDNDKTIDWDDPSQLFVLTIDGQQKTQLTDDRFFLRTWTINRQSGSIVVAGHYDSNENGKYDNTDKSEILIYDLRTLKLLNRPQEVSP